MSEQRAKEFVQALANNPDLRTRLFNAQSPDERAQIIQQAGYGDVDPQEVRKLIAELFPVAPSADEVTSPSVNG